MRGRAVGRAKHGNAFRREGDRASDWRTAVAAVLRQDGAASKELKKADGVVGKTLRYEAHFRADGLLAEGEYVRFVLARSLGGHPTWRPGGPVAATSGAACMSTRSASACGSPEMVDVYRTLMTNPACPWLNMPRQEPIGQPTDASPRSEWRETVERKP